MNTGLQNFCYWKNFQQNFFFKFFFTIFVFNFGDFCGLLVGIRFWNSLQSYFNIRKMLIPGIVNNELISEQVLYLKLQWFLTKSWNIRNKYEDILIICNLCTCTSPTPSGTILPISRETSLPRGTKYFLN